MNADRFISYALTQSIQVVVVIAVVAIATLTLCRRRPHLAYALWLLAMVKCITPPVWSSPTSVFSWAASHVQSVPSSGESMVGAAPKIPLPPPDISVNSMMIDTPSPPAAPSRTALPRFLILAWLLGAIGYFLWAVSRLSRFRRHTETESLAPPDDLIDLLSELRHTLGVGSRVDLRITRSSIGPAVVGVLRPMIVIPQALLSSDREDLRRVLAHELIHVRRCDHWIAAMQTLVQAIWWPNPLVWWMNRRINQTRELSCDEEVIASLHCDAPSYVQMLLNVLHLQRKLAVPAIGVGMQSFEMTTRRMDHLLSTRQFKSRAPWKSWIAFLIGALALLPGAGLAIVQHDAAQPQSSQPTTAATGTVRFDGLVTDFTTNKPIGGATVLLRTGGFYDPEGPFTPPSGPTLEGTSGPDGKVAIDIPLEGTRQNSFVDIRVRHPNYAPRTAGVAGLWLDGAPRKVIVRDKLTLIAGEELTGVVEDTDGKPLANTKVHIRSTAGDRQTRYLKEPPEVSFDSSTTDAQGRYRFNAIQGADFVTVTAEPTEYATTKQEVGNRRGDVGALRVQRGTRITGTLLDESGKPVSGMLIMAESTAHRDSQRDATTDAQGRYTLAPLPAGACNVRPFDNRFAPQTVTIPADAPADVMNADFRAAELVTIRGQVVLAKDSPRHRQPFEAMGTHGSATYRARTATDENGRFDFRVIKGVQNLDFNPSSANEGFVYQWKRGENGKLHGRRSIRLSVVDADVTDLIMIEQHAPTLTIKAVGQDGTSPPNGFGAEVRYNDPELWMPYGNSWKDQAQKGDVAIQYTKSHDRATTYGMLPDREFTVTVWASGYEPASQTLKLGEGESREIEIKLRSQGAP